MATQKEHMVKKRACLVDSEKGGPKLANKAQVEVESESRDIGSEDDILNTGA